MRELSSLVVAARQMPNSNVHSIEDCLAPNNYNGTRQAVKLVAGFDATTRKYKNPSLAQNIGYLLKRCALILHSEGMIEDDERKQKNGKIFEELYDAEWADRISSGALQTIDINKSNQMKLLPLCEDVQTLFAHVKVKSAQLRTQVKVHSSCHGDFIRYT